MKVINFASRPKITGDHLGNLAKILGVEKTQIEVIETNPLDGRKTDRDSTSPGSLIKKLSITHQDLSQGQVVINLPLDDSIATALLLASLSGQFNHYPKILTWKYFTDFPNPAIWQISGLIDLEEVRQRYKQ